MESSAKWAATGRAAPTGGVAPAGPSVWLPAAVSSGRPPQWRPPSGWAGKGWPGWWAPRPHRGSPGCLPPRHAPPPPQAPLVPLGRVPQEAWQALTRWLCGFGPISPDSPTPHSSQGAAAALHQGSIATLAAESVLAIIAIIAIIAIVAIIAFVVPGGRDQASRGASPPHLKRYLGWAAAS